MVIPDEVDSKPQRKELNNKMSPLHSVSTEAGWGTGRRRKYKDVEEAGPLISEPRWSAGKIMWEGEIGEDVRRKGVNGRAGKELHAKAI